MKKQMKVNQPRSVSRSARFFRVGLLVAGALLTVGVITVIARHGSGANDAKDRIKNGTMASQSQKNHVTVEFAGRKLQVDAETLQQRPLTQDETQQIADALKNNKSTDGLQQIQHPDGTVSMDLQGRFQNVMLARKNDDGSVSQACVDNSQAAAAFLQGKEDSTQESQPGGKVAVKIQ
jgi:hypothetical protein